MACVKRVPLPSVRRAAVYQNKNKLSLSEIIGEQQPDIALTGAFYNKNWKPVCPVKADGEVLYADAQYNYWALAWDEGADAEVELIMPGGESDKKNYVANCTLITCGRPHDTLYYNADVGGRRGRTAMGLTEAGEWLFFACGDSSEDACTPEQLRDRLAAEGCFFAIMLDGGRKVNYYDRKAEILLEGKDPSRTLILLWLDEPCDGEKSDAGDIKTYSVKADGDMYLSKNFRVREFACADKSDAVPVSDKLVALLQQIRDHFGKAVTITSGYRTASHNAKVGGTARSQHLCGTAADIVVAGAEPQEVAQYAEFLQPTAGGIGVYKTFTHVDVRETRSRWDSRSGKEVSVTGWPGYSGKSEAELALEWMKGCGIMRGDSSGDMMPDEPITRRQLAIMLYRQAKREGKL